MTNKNTATLEQPKEAKPKAKPKTTPLSKQAREILNDPPILLGETPHNPLIPDGVLFPKFSVIQRTDFQELVADWQESNERAVSLNRTAARQRREAIREALKSERDIPAIKALTEELGKVYETFARAKHAVRSQNRGKAPLHATVLTPLIDQAIEHATDLLTTVREEIQTGHRRLGVADGALPLTSALSDLVEAHIQRLESEKETVYRRANPPLGSPMGDPRNPETILPRTLFTLSDSEIATKASALL